jgi:hypothetical protein
MRITRRNFVTLCASSAAALALGDASSAEARAVSAGDVIKTWYDVMLELVRHTATYTPPVASRTFAYLGVAAHEALCSGHAGLKSLAGQLKGLQPLPARKPGVDCDDAMVMHAVMGQMVGALFGNTGPTGQRVLKAVETRLRTKIAAGLAPETVLNSESHGAAIARHILDWAAGDGGATITNMGFPATFEFGQTPSSWVPTSLVRLQQMPLLPQWGQNRPFAMPSGNACPLPPPPVYSEEAGSPFHAEAMEVYKVTRALTAEQKAIARFWSDDPMLSPTPPGHWISIVLQIAERDSMPHDRLAEILARLGVAMADAFIGCWHSKFEHDLLRPVSYIRRVIDKTWEPLLITPPFPEYPSGHSTQSGAAEAVLTAFFGEGFAFEDATHSRDGIKPRQYASFRQAAEEAGISRLYGGIHFRAGVERGLEQGRCIGAHAVQLVTRTA